MRHSEFVRLSVAVDSRVVEISDTAGNRTTPCAALSAVGLSACRISRILAGLLLLSLIGCTSKSGPIETDTDEAPSAILADAQKHLDAEDYEQALNRANNVPAESALRGRAMLIAGQAAFELQQFSDAAQYFAQVPKNHSEYSLALFSQAEATVELGQLTSACDLFEQVLRITPDNVATHGQLASLYTTTGNREASKPHYLALIQSGSVTLEELALFADLQRPVERLPYLQQCAQQAPHDRLVRQGIAAHLFWDGQTADAQAMLVSLITEFPEALEAQAMLGEILLNTAVEQLPQWDQRLPAAAEQHPQIWYVRGLWARSAQDLPLAARCFREAIRLAPADRSPVVQLGQTLSALKDSDAAAVNARADVLIRLSQRLDDVLTSQGKDSDQLHDVAAALERSGRIWEACAWALFTRQAFPQENWPEQIFARHTASLQPSLPRTLRAFELTTRDAEFNATEFRKVAAGWIAAPSRHTGREQPPDVRFEEADIGIDFVYFNGDDPQTPGVRMFEQTGGGVAVLDLDRDMWPDVFLPQGLPWNTGDAAPVADPEFQDQLFRNTHGTGFRNVSTAAIPTESGFGQGCTVGDFDNDGFPDLYIANIGRNQLLRNMGDGSFLDVSEDAGLQRNDWTTSVLLTDLNADENPDLFDVNYVRGPGVYEAICGGKGCSPGVFQGTPDQLLIANGAGEFRLLADAAPTSDSKGLGIVAVALDDPRRPLLFIANDQVANHSLVNLADSGPANIRLENRALVSGLAFNEDGVSMACMGIAADDINGDGRTDLFVTNFADEPNTLYLQDVAGLFVDATRTSGLKPGGYPFVSWGTQFLDADLDGDSDLVIVSGHVDDYRAEGGSYRMRPQCYQNHGGTDFTELSVEQCGSFFEKQRLGRAVARCDWNADGRTEFISSGILEPSVMAVNRSAGQNHYINVCFTATTTARDAIGAHATVTTETATWTKQLLAGDGYMASNERILQFGVGAATEVRQLTIHWPSGVAHQFRDIGVDTTYLAGESGRLLKIVR